MRAFRPHRGRVARCPLRLGAGFVQVFPDRISASTSEPRQSSALHHL